MPVSEWVSDAISRQFRPRPRPRCVVVVSLIREGSSSIGRRSYWRYVPAPERLPVQCAFCSSLRRPHWQGPGSGQPIADGSSLLQSAQATSGNLWRQKIGPSRAESPSSDQMKRSWLGTDRRGDSFVVRRFVSRSVSLGCSEMIGTYLTSASTTDERYDDVPRPTSARGWAASWRRGSSAAHTPHPAAFSSHLAFSATYIQVQVQVHMYVHAYPGP